MSLRTSAVFSKYPFRKSHFTEPKEGDVIQEALAILNNKEGSPNAQESIQIVACYGRVPTQCQEEVHIQDMTPTNFIEWSQKRKAKIASLKQSGKDNLLNELIQEFKNEKIQALFKENSDKLFNFFKGEINSLQKHLTSSDFDAYSKELEVINDTYLQGIRQIPLSRIQSANDPTKRWDTLLKQIANRLSVKKNFENLFNEILGNNHLSQEIRHLYFKRTVDLLLEYLFGNESHLKNSAPIWMATISNALRDIDSPAERLKKPVEWQPPPLHQCKLENALIISLKRIQVIHKKLYPHSQNCNFELDKNHIPSIDLKLIKSSEAWKILLESLNGFEKVSLPLIFFYSQFAWFILDQYLMQEDPDLKFCLLLNESLFLKRHYLGNTFFIFEACEHQYVAYHKKISSKLTLDSFQEAKHAMLTRKTKIHEMTTKHEREFYFELSFKCNSTGHVPLMNWAYEVMNHFHKDEDMTTKTLTLPSLLLMQVIKTDLLSLQHTVSNCMHQFITFCHLLMPESPLTHEQKLYLTKPFKIATGYWLEKGFNESNIQILAKVFHPLSQLIETNQRDLVQLAAPFIENFSDKCIDACRNPSEKDTLKEVESRLLFSLLLLKFKESRDDYKPSTFHLWSSIRMAYLCRLPSSSQAEQFEQVVHHLVDEIKPTSRHLQLFQANKTLFKRLIEKEGALIASSVDQNLWVEYVAAVQEHNNNMLKDDPIDLLKWTQ